MKNNLLAIHHVSFIVQDTQASIDFYTQILGVSINKQRPDLGYAGAWLDVNEYQQIHLLELPNPDPIHNRPVHGGRDRHVAFSVANLQLIIDKLEYAKITYSLSKSGRRALFFRDLDGNAIELIEAK